MDHRYVASIEAPKAAVFDVLTDVGTYDRWLDFVQRVEPDPDAEVGAWFFTLRARIGPFARSKRLRVVETANVAPNHVRVERDERDDRDHAPWVFDAVLTDGETATSTVVALTLTYGGRLWTSALNPVLHNQLRAATEQLEALTS